jgi:arginyl-tRNA synthetase
MKWESLRKNLEKFGSGAKQVSDFAGQAGMTGTSDKAGNAANLAMTGARAAAGDPMAIAQLAMEAKKAVEEKIQQVKDIGGHLIKAGTSSTVEGSVGEGFSSVESAGKAMGDMGKPIEYVGKFGKMVAESVAGLRRWNDQLHDSNMQFAEFSASMSQVRAEQMMRDIDLSRARGDRRAARAGELAQAKHRLNVSMAPFEDKLADVQSRFTIWWSDFASKELDKIRATLEKIGVKLDSDENKGKGESLTDWMRGEAGDILATGKVRRPNRMKP